MEWKLGCLHARVRSAEGLSKPGSCNMSLTWEHRSWSCPRWMSNFTLQDHGDKASLEKVCVWKIQSFVDIKKSKWIICYRLHGASVHMSFYRAGLKIIIHLSCLSSLIMGWPIFETTSVLGQFKGWICLVSDRRICSQKWVIDTCWSLHNGLPYFIIKWYFSKIHCTHCVKDCA